MGIGATGRAATRADQVASDLSRFAASLSSGGLLGVGLLGVVEIPGLLVLSLALLHQALCPNARQHDARVGFPLRLGLSLVFSISTAGIAGYWVPEALASLGASPKEATLGFIMAVAWVALPHLMILAMTMAGAPDRGSVRLAATALPVFALETILPVLPGSVPFTLLGHAALANGGLAQLAAATGVPGVSALVAAAGWGLRELIARPAFASRRWPVAVLIAYATASLTGLPLARAFATNPGSLTAPSDEAVSFLALQPTLPRAERLRPSLQAINAERLVRLSRAQARNETFVVWPENALVEDVAGGDNALSLVRDAADTLGHRLITGVSRLAPGEEPGVGGGVLLGSVVVARPFDPQLEVLDKRRAVPLLEAEDAHPLLHGLGALIGAAGHSARVRQAAPSGPISEAGGAVVLLCFEALFPRLASERRPERATALLVLADDSWIEDWIARRQLARFARYRAIEQRLPLLRVAHGGLSVHIDRLGQPVESLPPNVPGALRLIARASTGPSSLERLCLVGAPIGAAGTFLMLSAARRRRARPRPRTGSRRAPQLC